MIINKKAGVTIVEPGEADYQDKTWRRWFIGNPLRTADSSHQTIGKAVGLAVFASDALSSTAYATQEIMFILAAAGTAGLAYVFPIALAIVALMVTVAISYEQTIHAYPGGGGSYIVARDNLGELPAQIAGASLLTDYILTVAVSISSGVAQIVSAFPAVYNYRVPLSVGLVMFVMLMNLRGVKESGKVFALPVYFFISTMGITVAVGLFRYFSGSLGTVVNPPAYEIEGGLALITPFLLLHAFSSGTSALTGIEAISNGITAFKEPRSRNAGITLIWMTAIMGSLFLGISYLASVIHAVPSEHETVISQITRTAMGGEGILYLIVISGTALILILAANTAFADFPRLGAIQAADGYLPRQFTFKGSRLVFSWGIVTLAAVSSLLIIVFNASVNRLIPLYAIGVFLSFTLSQAGMAHRWWKSGKLQPGQKVVERGSTLTHDKAWRAKIIINSLGAIATAVVALTFAVVKFKDGAWVVLIIIPALVLMFMGIHRHYRGLAKKLSLDDFTSPPKVAHHRVVILISGVHRGSLSALNYARSLGHDVTAVHVSIDEAETERLKQKWFYYGDGVRLVILESPYRLMIEPIIQYIERLLAIQQHGERLTIVVPQFVPRHWWENLLHNQTALMLRFALIFKPGLVIVEIPYQV